jgi:putative transposase
MRLMRLMPIYQKPNTSKPAKGHKTYPYLLGGLRIDRPNQVWWLCQGNFSCGERGGRLG